ncbi:MAG: hypothetical protein EBX36_06600, partial [Planctomycetia bacterium]|nr:hypothetical protein [Planctomycetia bacterium]
MRSPVRRVVSALGLALLCAVVPDGATRRAAAERPTATGAELSAAWSATAADLVRRAKAGGHVELAAAIEGWDVPEPGDRQCVLAIPDVPPEDAIPDWLDTAAERSIWDEFLAARRTRAAGTFALAVAATRRPSPQPPRATAAEAPERRPAEPDATEAIRLLYRSLRDDPDHARAREAAGWVRRDGRWLWPEAARHLDRGEEHSVEFGWLPRGREDRYRAGERFA